jgi:hypothetical protein
VRTQQRPRVAPRTPQTLRRIRRLPQRLRHRSRLLARKLPAVGVQVPSARDPHQQLLHLALQLQTTGNALNEQGLVAESRCDDALAESRHRASLCAASPPRRPERGGRRP